MSDRENGRVSDRAVLESVAAAIRSRLVDPSDAGHRRTVDVQVLGLVEYVARRGPDPSATRRDELAAALDRLRDNPLLAAQVGREPADVAAAVLVAAVGRVDRDARAVQQVLRPLLVGHLDDELASTAPLLDAFRGRVRDE